MALDSRPGSFLPAIKCSTCGNDIDITSLADHVCVPSRSLGDDTTNVPSTARANMNGDPAVQSIPWTDPAVQPGSRFLDVEQSLRSPGFSQRSGKSAPPKIDPAAANRPFLQADALTPLSDYSNYSDTQGLTPVTPNTQITTPSSMFSRKPSYPSRSPSPPSPNYAMNLDSAFPPFRSAYDAPSDGYRPNLMRPMASPGANVLQRMNTLAEGPFSTQRSQVAPAPLRERRPSNDRYGQQNQESRPQEHYRKVSEPRAQTSNHSPPRDNQNHARKPSRESTKKVVDSIDMFLQDMDADHEPAPMLNHESRSRTFPEHTESQPRHNQAEHFRPPVSAAHNRTDFFPEVSAEEITRPSTSAGSRNKPKGRFDAFKDPAIQNPFIPASRQNLQEEEQTQDRRRIVTNANSPEIDPKSPWFEAPRASPLPPNTANRSPPRAPSHSSNGSQSRSRTMTRENGPTAVDRFMENRQAPPAHPVLALMRQENSSRSDVSHSPSDSSSSYASSIPSTAPTSVVSISRSVSSESNSSSRRRGISRPQIPDALPPPTIPYAKVPQPLESPIDPAIHQMRSPRDPAIQVGAIGPSRSYISNSPPRPRAEPNATIYERAPPVFQAPVSKGECRGCCTEIYGKSVKAADGRLTGRYHKECFVCKECQAPFLTAEFYVLNNAPYCSRHYHELNGSMCYKCNRGIEGQYLETDRRQKYHATCFSCSHCRVRLNDDYYEVDGKPFCERHAFAMSRQRGPNAPTAEKRRTRLMFM